MASLAFVVALIIFSFWLVAGLSLVASFLEFRFIGAILGIFSIVIGLWLLFTLPYAPFLWIINLSAGLFAVCRYKINV